MIEGLGGTHGPARRHRHHSDARRRSTRSDGSGRVTGTGVGPELIRLDGVDASYGRHRVLEDVSFHVHEDQFTGIVGPSGAGKTTLLRPPGDPRPGGRHRLAPARTPRRLRASARDGQLELPGHRVRVRPHVPQVRPTTAMGECPGEGQRRRGPRAPRHRRPVAAAHPRAVGRPAAADVPGQASCASPRFFSWTSRRAASTCRRGTATSLHLLADLHEDGVAIVLTTHDLNGMAAHLPHLVCVNHHRGGRGSARGHHALSARAHLRRAHGGARAPGHAGGRGRAPSTYVPGARP